jgi:hypothetical protein
VFENRMLKKEIYAYRLQVFENRMLKKEIYAYRLQVFENRMLKKCEGFYGSDDLDHDLFDYDAVQSLWWLPMFQRNLFFHLQDR